jgi:ABC-type antimicrobial peptide transport system permease subunit
MTKNITEQDVIEELESFLSQPEASELSSLICKKKFEEIKSLLKKKISEEKMDIFINYSKKKSEEKKIFIDLDKEEWSQIKIDYETEYVINFGGTIIFNPFFTRGGKEIFFYDKNSDLINIKDLNQIWIVKKMEE